MQYQLRRAEALYQSGLVREAEDAATGALLLLRRDDELLSATRGRGKALLESAHAAARKGNEGRAQALYQLSLRVEGDEPTKQDISGHLKALASWQKSTERSTALTQVGDQVRRALSRSVVDPGRDSYEGAQEAIVSWMRAALSSRILEQGPQSPEEREQALEAYRAVRGGADAMVALHLRQGSPASAIGALDQANLSGALSPGMRTVLEGTAQNEPAAWMALFRRFDELRSAPEAELALPHYVADAAAFWAAISLYRSAPGDIESAMPLAMTLVEFAMPEVASTVLAQNSSAETRPEALAWSITLVIQGLLQLSRTNQLEAARRSYSEAEPLLMRAQSLPPSGPHPARASALMAALETRHGFVDRALPLLEQSARANENSETLLRLTRLLEQKGEAARAQSMAKRAVEIAQEEGDLLSEARAEEVLFRLHRKQGNAQPAEQALQRSLHRILVLQGMELPSVSKASIERHLAGVLQYFGATSEMTKAYRRAVLESRRSAVELEITLTDMARAGMTLGNVRITQEALKEAIDQGLPAENTIYIALWHQLNLKRSRHPTDGLSHQVLLRASDATGWLEALRTYGLGTLPVQQLRGKAEGIAERTEADFYQALSLTDTSHQQLLAEVAKSAAVDLVEVRVAADLLANGNHYQLPQDVRLP